MILDDLVAATKRRLKTEMQLTSLADVKRQAHATPTKNPHVIYDYFTAPGMHLIGEVKQASPSKGQIATTDFPYVTIAQEYERAGVSAISVLTEPDYFKGDINYLTEITEHITTPVLRKDFIIDDYMLYQTKVAGASIVLLIIAILTPAELKHYLALAHKLGLAALVEAHDEAEMTTALEAGAQMIGVNNRDLKTFDVSLANSLRLRPLAPANIAFIAESGIRTRADVAELEAANVNGVLIGETLMRAVDKRAMINDLLGVTVHDTH